MAARGERAARLVGAVVITVILLLVDPELARLCLAAALCYACLLEAQS